MRSMSFEVKSYTPVQCFIKTETVLIIVPIELTLTRTRILNMLKSLVATIVSKPLINIVDKESLRIFTFKRFGWSDQLSRYYLLRRFSKIIIFTHPVLLLTPPLLTDPWMDGCISSQPCSRPSFLTQRGSKVPPLSACYQRDNSERPKSPQTRTRNP